MNSAAPQNFRVGRLASDPEIIATAVLVSAAAVVGLSTAADYGISIDEFNADDYGPKALAWYTSGFANRSHFETVEAPLPWFQIVTAYIQSFDLADRFDVRHAMTFLGPGIAHGNEYGHWPAEQLGGDRGQSVELTLSKPIFHCHIMAFYKARFSQAIAVSAFARSRRSRSRAQTAAYALASCVPMSGRKSEAAKVSLFDDLVGAAHCFLEYVRQTVLEQCFDPAVGRTK
jgi:hypothetical protein